MLYLLLGSDDFSKTENISALAKRAGIEPEFFVDQENVLGVENLSGQDLFSRPKIFVLKNLTSKYNSPEIVEKFIASKNHIIFSEEKLDKRLGDNKKLLANSKINIQEFILPHGKGLDEWIINRVKFLGGTIATSAVEALAKALGRDQAKETRFGGKVVDVQEVYSLWQADSEIKKLVALAGEREVSAEDVKALVNENQEVDVFDLTNAVAEGRKLQALELLHLFLKHQTGSDEKGAVIQLNALLSEQFRNVAMVQDFLNQKTSEEDILESTGWKSGRLFVMKKIAARFEPKKVMDCLNKLSALDEELKTSQTPPKVLLDLIFVQLL